MAAGGSDLETSFKSSGPGVPLKVVLVGVKGVGKTTLFRRIFSGGGKFSEEKCSNVRDCFTQPIRVDDGRTVQMRLFDTAGMEGTRHDRNLTRSYFVGSQVALLVYSADDWDSVVDLLEYARDVQTHAPEAKKFLIRNKVDLPKEDQIDINDVDAIFAKNDLPFAPYWKFKTSASTGEGVNTLLNEIGKALLSQGPITPNERNSFQVYRQNQNSKTSKISSKCC